MFDTVIVDKLMVPKLPKEVNDYLSSNNHNVPVEFQTKDLDCVLTTYKIDKKGQLWRETRRPTGKKVPFKPFFEDWHKNRPFLERLYLKFTNKSSALKTPRKVDEYKTIEVKDTTTGTIEIYTYDEIGGRYVELNYSVILNKGKVDTLKLVNWQIEPLKTANARRVFNIEFDKKMQEEFNKKKAFQAKWYYPILRETYTPLVFFTRITVQSICNKILNWSHHWHGV